MTLPAHMQPGHAAVLVIAVVLLLWKAIGYFAEVRRLSDVKYDAGKPTIVGAPGSTRAMQEAEK